MEKQKEQLKKRNKKCNDAFIEEKDNELWGAGEFCLRGFI